MRRVAFLLAVIIILIVASLAIGLGWYIYIPKKITEIIGREQQGLPAGNISGPIPLEGREVTLKIGEKAAYKRSGYAEINVTVMNIDNFGGYARLEATLYYARIPVANSTVLIENINPKQAFTKTITIRTTKEWNAFDVRQV